MARPRKTATKPTVKTEIKPKEAPKKEVKPVDVPELKDNEKCVVVGTGKSPHLKKGQESETFGNCAKILIKNGLAVLK